MKKNRSLLVFLTTILITTVGLVSGQPAFIGVAVTAVNQYYDLQEVEEQ